MISLLQLVAKVLYVSDFKCIFIRYPFFSGIILHTKYMRPISPVKIDIDSERIALECSSYACFIGNCWQQNILKFLEIRI